MGNLLKFYEKADIIKDNGRDLVPMKEPFVDFHQGEGLWLAYNHELSYEDGCFDRFLQTLTVVFKDGRRKFTEALKRWHAFYSIFKEKIWMKRF